MAMVKDLHEAAANYNAAKKQYTTQVVKAEAPPRA